MLNKLPIYHLFSVILLFKFYLNELIFLQAISDLILILLYKSNLFHPFLCNHNYSLCPILSESSKIIGHLN